MIHHDYSPAQLEISGKNYKVLFLIPYMDSLLCSEKLDTFHTSVRVYFEDTDAGGIVYYVNYLKFMERARTEFLRHLGHEQRVMLEQQRMFVVANCSVNYRRPALLDDLLQVTVEVESVGKVRLVLRQLVCRGEEVLCEGRFVIGCVHSQTVRPARIPQDLRNKCGETQ